MKTADHCSGILVVGTIPVLIAGAALKKYAEGPWRTLFVMGTTLIVLGIVMYFADRRGQNKRGLDSMNWTDAIAIGVAQALAVVPGVSRSGITITAARFRHLDREAAARFSFLLSTPAIAAAAAKDALDLRKEGGVPHDMQLPYLVGIVGQRAGRHHRDRLLSSLPPPQHAQPVRLVPSDLWHNSDRSGYLLSQRRMTLLSPSRHHRLNEAVGLLLLLLGLAVCLSLVSYSSSDPSWNTATQAGRTHNLLGLFGARWADFFLQVFGLSIFLLPVNIWALGWKWVRSSPIESTWFRVLGNLSLWFCLSAACGLVPRPWLIAGAVHPSGLVGMVIADFLLARFDVAGSAIITVASGVVALYFASTFEVSTLRRWLSGPLAKWRAFRAKLESNRVRFGARQQSKKRRRKLRREQPGGRRAEAKPAAAREARAAKTEPPAKPNLNRLKAPSLPRALRNPI